MSGKGGPDAIFETTFLPPGLYKIWVQSTTEERLKPPIIPLMRNENFVTGDVENERSRRSLMKV